MEEVAVGNTGERDEGVGDEEATVGLKTEDDALRQIESVGCVAAYAAGGRIQCREGVIAVAIAAPPPVEMEIVVGIVAITHKSMSARGVATRIENGAASRDIVFQILHPGSIGSSVAGGATQRGIVGEVGAKCHIGGGDRLALGDGDSTTARRVVLHGDRDAAMIHECAHGIELGVGAGTGEGIRHVCPIVLCGTKIGREVAVWGAVIRKRALSNGRKVPILHNLSHGSSHTTRDRPTRSIGRTEDIVVRRLIPSGGEQRLDSNG